MSEELNLEHQYKEIDVELAEDKNSFRDSTAIINNNYKTTCLLYTSDAADE